MSTTFMVVLGAAIALAIVITVLAAEHWFDLRRSRKSTAE
jgi:hypothetical protein